MLGDIIVLFVSAVIALGSVFFSAYFCYITGNPFWMIFLIIPAAITVAIALLVNRKYDRSSSGVKREENE